MIAKIKISGNISAGKQTLPPPTVDADNVLSVPSLLRNGSASEVAMDFFLNDNWAIEGSLGIIVYRTKSIALINIANNYGTTYSGKRRDVYGIPITGTLQYHIAPYGALRPYVGVGMSYSYMRLKCSYFKMQNDSGPVVQAGIDFVFTDDSVITFDVKRHWLSPKIHYSSSFITNNGEKIDSKVKINPTTISIGYGVRL
jgi:outer membrane protein